MKTYSDSIDIEASAQRVFEIVTDLPGMGRLSPENTGGQWVGSANGPAIGAKFRGHNARGDDRWATNVRVTTFDPPTDFAFDVTYGPFRVSRWRYEIESTSAGCRVVETWNDRRNWIARRPDRKKGFDRAEFTKHSIHATLERLKEVCETSPA